MAQRTEKIDKEVFDTFFKENYVPVEYAMVREELKDIIREEESIFADGTDPAQINAGNFILHMRSDIYGELEDCVTEAFAALNPEIVDAVMELGATQKDSDAVTEVYWDTVNQLFTGFLKQLYQELFEEGME